MNWDRIAPPVALVALVVLPIVAATAATTSCSPGAKQAEATIAQVSVTACQELSVEFSPNAGGVVGDANLLCKGIDDLAPLVQVVMNAAIWDDMKRLFMRQHGFLPKGLRKPE